MLERVAGALVTEVNRVSIFQSLGVKIGFFLTGHEFYYIPRKKQPILYSTERLKTKSTKKSLLSLSYAHLIFVTY